MATIHTPEERKKVLKKIVELKREFIKLQEYQSASLMRDLEKKYEDEEQKDKNQYSHCNE